MIAPKEWLDFHLGAALRQSRRALRRHPGAVEPAHPGELLSRALPRRSTSSTAPVHADQCGGLRTITSVADSGVATSPTLPERDDFYEIGLVQRSHRRRLNSRAIRSRVPGIDDDTVPGSAIVTSVNLAVGAHHGYRG